MAKSKTWISPRSRASHLQNGATKGSRTREETKLQNGSKGKAKAPVQSSVLRRSSSNKTLKAAEGGKSGSGSKTGGGTKTSIFGSSEGETNIKAPRPKPNRRQQMSRVKKYELEKQTLLIMDQMISQVKDFTNKERYFDYKKISSHIKQYSIHHTDCKKMWEQFKSRLRGQFKEGNEEMRQCRNEWNEDFWTHHYRSYSMRLSIYNKLISHPEITSDLDKLNNILIEQDRSYIHNELLDLEKNESELLPVLEEFDKAIKSSDNQEELDELDEVIQNFEKKFESSNPVVSEGSKRKYQCKDETEIFNRIMSRIHTELSLEYEKRVYSIPEEKAEPDLPVEEVDTEAAKVLDLSKNNTAGSETHKLDSKPSEKDNKEWSELEILRLLRGIYQYGETKWIDIRNTYEFENKTAHDISVKWMDIRFQMLKDLKKLNNKHQNSVKRLTWLVACIKKLEIKNGIYNENDDIYKNMRDYYLNFKSRMVKPEKKFITPIEGSNGDVLKVPMFQSDKLIQDEEDGEDPEMRHYLSLAERGMKIFEITKNAPRDQDSVSQSKNGGKRSYKRRKYWEGEDDTDYYSDGSYCDVIPPKIMYGTINTLYKDYIKMVDWDKHPEFLELGKKYYSRALFSIDKTEHKKFVKEKKREAKRIK